MTISKVNSQSKTDNNATLASSIEFSGVITRFKKGQASVQAAITLGLVKSSFQYAIEYTGIASGVRGAMLFLGIFGGASVFWIGSFLAREFWEGGISGPLTALSFLLAICIIITSVYLALKSVRYELFRPLDEPIIFDRKHRKVYRIYREVYAGWRGLLMPWPMKFAEHDWDLVEAEHQVAVSTNGSTITRYHALVFLVRKSKDDGTLTDSFSVGNSMLLGELTLPAVWEHIRRFMEEGGPHLPPGDVLMKNDAPKSLLRCLWDSGPYGKNFLIWWREVELLLVLVLIFFPVLFPIFTAIGFFSWLSYKTSVSIAWPEHVCRAVNS